MLSVCLVAANAILGGSFSIRYAQENMVFDWAASATNAVQWAAFYSDCEHEVHEVTDGHRITLTYNLFLTARNDLQAGCQLSLDASQLPFSKLLKSAMSDPRFMFGGGKVGIYFTHRYPHAHPKLSSLLPACLKGMDMSIYESARALRLKINMGCTTKWSMGQADDWRYDEDSYDSDGEEKETTVFGKYFSGLLTLHADGTDPESNDDPHGLDDAEPMREGEFVLLNSPSYEEMYKAAMTVSIMSILIKYLEKLKLTFLAVRQPSPA